VALSKVIKTMKETGADMNEEYKEPLSRPNVPHPLTGRSGLEYRALMDHEGPWRFPRPRAMAGPARSERSLSSTDQFLLNMLAIMGMHRIESAAERAESPRDALVEVALTPSQWQHIFLLLSQDGSERSRTLLEALSGWETAEEPLTPENGHGREQGPRRAPSAPDIRR
jgi:hypothetical protein